MATTLRSSGIQMGSSILDVSGSAPSYPCRAWVNFNGTGTVSIRASGNVSSITDYGTGNYRANFSTALPNANYAFGFGVGTNDRTIRAYSSTTWLTTSFRFYNQAGYTGVVYDEAYVTVLFIN